MANTQAVENAGTAFSKTLNAAAGMPGVRIHRDTYLRTALKRYCSEAQIERATAESPAAAGIPGYVITQVANASIKYETSKATGLSALAGIPGGFAMLGTIPADLAQYIAHMLRIAQKLAYIYSWPDLFGDDDEMDEATEGILTLFLGVMFGVQLAQSGVTKLSAMMAAQVVKKAPATGAHTWFDLPDREESRGVYGREHDEEDLRGRCREGHPGRRCGALGRVDARDVPPHVEETAEASREPRALQAGSPLARSETRSRTATKAT